MPIARSARAVALFAAAAVLGCTALPRTPDRHDSTMAVRSHAAIATDTVAPPPPPPPTLTSTSTSTTPYPRQPGDAIRSPQDVAAEAASACQRPRDYIVQAANKELATSLEQAYRDVFPTEQSGAVLLLQSRSDDPRQQRALEALRATPGVQLKEEARFEEDGAGADPLQARNQPLWDAIHMPAPSALRPARAPVHVAVIDGPIRADHPDLPRVIQIQPRLRDADGQCGGQDCCPQFAAVKPHDHGTRVAGLIGALRDNATGIAGLARVGDIVSINTHLDGCTGELRLAAALMCALEYRSAADGGRIRVANISMGSEDTLRTTAVTDALWEATRAGLLVVASAGNKDKDISRTWRWPAIHPGSNMIAVESRNYDGSRAAGSNYGVGVVDLGAPAPQPYGQQNNLCSTDVHRFGQESICSGGDYSGFDRTSAAAAVVSGAAALLLGDERYAACTAEQLRTVLLRSRLHCEGPAGSADKVCQLDLAFLSDPANVAPEPLCASP